jgi:hypothetical protein
VLGTRNRIKKFHMNNDVNIPTDTTALSDRLVTLQTEARARHANWKSSHAEILKQLTSTYLWWREAREADGYLDAEFEKAGIQWKVLPDGAINFNPTVRLVFGLIADLSPSDRVTVSLWSKALRSIHARYEQSPGEFATKPEKKIVEYAKDQGGIAGLAYPDDSGDHQQSGPKPRPARPEPHPNPNPDPEPPLPDIGPLVLENLDGWQSRAAPNGSGLAVMLVWLDGDTFKPFGFSTCEEHIATVAAEAATRERAFMSPLLRGIVDTIETQAAPFEAIPIDEDKRKQYLERRYASGKNKSGKVVLIRNGAIQMTETKGACVVSTFTPVAPIDHDAPLRLTAAAAMTVEGWFDGGRLAGIHSERDDGIEPSATAPANYDLPFRDAGRGRPGCLVLTKSDETVIGFEAQETWSWIARVDGYWLRTLGQEWADDWFGGLGRHNHIKRDNNATLSLEVSPEAVTIRYNRLAATKTFAWDAQCDPGQHEAVYASADLGPVLYRLTRARIIDDAVISGDANALLIEYETAAGKFSIAVPTRTADGKPDATLFQRVAA